MPKPNFVHECVREMALPRRGKAKKSVEQIAARLGDISASTIYDYGNGGSNLPAYLVPLLSNATNDTLLIETLCGLCGGTYVPKATGKDISGEMLPVALKDVGEWVAEIGASLADGEVDDKELRRIRKKALDLRGVISAIDVELKQLANKNDDGREPTLADAEKRGQGHE